MFLHLPILQVHDYVQILQEYNWHFIVKPLALVGTKATGYSPTFMQHPLTNQGANARCVRLYVPCIMVCVGGVYMRASTHVRWPVCVCLIIVLLAVTWYMFKTIDGYVPQHNGWAAHNINNKCNWRSYWADGQIIPNFRKNTKVAVLSLLGLSVCRRVRHTVMDGMSLWEQTTLHPPQEIRWRAKDDVKTTDTIPLIQRPDETAPRDFRAANTAEWITGSTKSARRAMKHVRQEQISQGVLVRLCHMFARLTDDQVRGPQPLVILSQHECILNTTFPTHTQKHNIHVISTCRSLVSSSTRSAAQVYSLF